MKPFFKFKAVYFILAVLLLLSVPAGVIAVNRGISPSVVAGNYVQKYENRVDFTVTNTEFTLTKSNNRNETFLLTFSLAVKKGEPDIYAKINTVELLGLPYNYMIFSASADNGSDTNPIGLTLYENELQWTVEVSVDFDSVQNLTPSLQIGYESGLTPDTTEEYHLTVPMNIQVIKK